MALSGTSAKSKTTPRVDDKRTAAGIDVGGTKIAYALVSDCKLVSQRKHVPTQQARQPNIDSILRIVEELKSQAKISGIGIATCGMINNDGKIIGSAENISGWQDTELKQLIQEGSGLPVEVENDANASAYGEYRAYNLGAESSVAVITIGTGIGGGLIINGEIVRGAHFAAGEVGHMQIVQGHHRKCSCELWDCFEAYGSGRGLIATAAEILQGSGNEQLHLANEQSQLWSQRENLTTRLIFEAAGNNDPAAITAVKLWHEHLSQGICIVAQVFDPEVFILTGGLSMCVDYPLLNKLTNERAVIGLAGNIKIHPSLLGENPGLIGAAQLLLDKLAVGEENR